MDEKNTREINLLELMGLFFNWLKKLGLRILNGIGFLARLSFKWYSTVIIVVLVCFAIGQFMARESARTYKAEAMTMIYGSDAQTVRQVCKQLENTLSTNSLISLGTKLSIPDSIANNVVSIKSSFVIDYLRDSVADVIDFYDNHSLEDTMNVRMRDRIYLQLQTRNISQVPVIQEAILNYFNNNEVIRTQFQISQNSLKEEIRICDRELQRIDSVAQVTYFKDNNSQLRFDKEHLLLGEQRKQLFYNEMLQLLRFKAAAELKFGDFTQPVRMPSGLVVNPQPINNRLRNAIYSILIGYALALIIIILAENFRRMLKYLKN